MNLQDELYDQIDNYLNGTLSEKERIAFEEKIAQNNALASKVSQVRATNDAIYYGSLAELKATIGQDIKKIKYKEPLNWTKISIISIASLALLSGVTSYLNTGDTKNNTKKIDSTSIIETPLQKTILKKNTSSETEKIIVDNNTQPIASDQKLNTDTTLVNKTTTIETVLPNTKEQKTTTEPKQISIENNTPKNKVDSNSKKIEQPVLKESIVSCDKTFNILTNPSCQLEETGSITITSDGTHNYLFQVDNHSNSGSKGFFQHISIGDHEIQVTYGKACLYKTKVTIKEKWCPMNTPYSFNPDYHEKWTMQYETGASGNVTIYNRSGKEVYTSIFGSGNEFWDGSDIHGGMSSVGIYLAVIKYSDGRQENVELTIVR